MKWFTLVILLLVCASSYGLSCLYTEDREPLYVLLPGLNSNDVVCMIQDLPTEIDDDYSLCRIEFYVSYTEHILIVSLTEHLQESLLEDQHIQIDTMVDGLETDDIGVVHYLEHACSKDGCEITFVTQFCEFLNWFLHTDYPALSTQLAPFIFNDYEDPGNCLNRDNVVEKCSSGLCVARLSQENDEDSIQNRFCANNNVQVSAGLYYTLVFDLNFEDRFVEYIFYCEYDECNDNSTFSEAVAIFKKEHDIVSLLTIFGYESENGTEETTTSSTKSPTLSSSTKSPTSSSSTKSPTSCSSTKLPTSSSSTKLSTPSSSTKSSTSNTNPDINRTVTTTGGTTIQANNGLHIQSTNPIIFIAWMTFMFRFIILA